MAPPLYKGGYPNSGLGQDPAAVKKWVTATWNSTQRPYDSNQAVFPGPVGQLGACGVEPRRRRREVALAGGDRAFQHVALGLLQGPRRSGGARRHGMRNGLCPLEVQGA